MGKKVIIEERDGVEGKYCTRCSEWKPFDEYSRSKGGTAGRHSLCKVCKSNASKKYSFNRSEYNKRYYAKNVKYHRERSKKYRENNLDERRLYDRRYREENKEKRSAYMSEWSKQNKPRRQANEHRRRSRLTDLESKFDYGDQEIVLDRFKGCALTGSHKFHWDHVIPVSLRREGTTLKNMIPLRPDLNLSKQNQNIFEWFEANRQRFKLSEEKFKQLIVWLATANATTSEKYRDYVYWCHDNPRIIDESEESG